MKARTRGIWNAPDKRDKQKSRKQAAMDRLLRWAHIPFLSILQPLNDPDGPNENQLVPSQKLSLSCYQKGYKRHPVKMKTPFNLARAGNLARAKPFGYFF